MWFLHVLVVTAVLQWSVVTGEGQADQLTLSLCRVWEECLEKATENNLENSELGTPEAICGDFLDMLEKHGVDCGTLDNPEETADVGQELSSLEPLPNDQEQQQESVPIPGDEEETNREEHGHKQLLPQNHPASTDDLWRTTYFDDCSEIYTAQDMFGSPSSGVFPIKPLHVNNPVSVYCDQTTAGGGWTVIQRRFDGSLEFFRRFNAYRDGFGDSSGEHWLGLDNIYRITAQNAYELYVELEDWSENVKFARYSRFSVGPGSDYILSVGGYSGTAGDGFYLSLTGSSSNNNGRKFSTRLNDRDTYSGSMAEYYGGGWWYGYSSRSSLNGPYFRDTDVFNINNGFGVQWYPFNSILYYSLKKTKMMVRPTDFSARVANLGLGKK
ncbi:PREDICTED: fibrinogen-like protein 1 isoform X1 [Branchiostoma belcheri]|uniref:Fibrinogen-like protein 1 isoform X1 n=1 Tax=Branchiostoma belcheri TaxID=7741 RepID=A0A6P4ZW19_BRABE|nr:PREDICTED: fibrinogen-like protein 1 isoform X1 [Branchiostoma belcheri]